MSQQDRVS